MGGRAATVYPLWELGIVGLAWPGGQIRESSRRFNLDIHFEILAGRSPLRGRISKDVLAAQIRIDQVKVVCYLVEITNFV